MRHAFDLARLLLEWTDEEAQRYIGYYDAHNGRLADVFETAGYTLSLWHYPAEDIYEVNVNYKGLDFTDPEVQRRRQSVTGYMPTHQLEHKMRHWFKQHGHLVMGSADSRKVAIYKRLCARALKGQIVDIEQSVPGGGSYFFVIGWDKEALDRIRVEPEQPGAQVKEAVDPKEFIDQNPSNHVLKQATPKIWEVYDNFGMLLGRVYYSDDTPPEAHQFWRDNPWGVILNPDVSSLKSFKTKEDAISYILREKSLLWF